MKALCFDEKETWDDLDSNLKEIYLDEARYYINNKDDWPVEILLRLENHGLSEQRI